MTDHLPATFNRQIQFLSIRSAGFRASTTTAPGSAGFQAGIEINQSWPI
jgi:hypothetical protein